MSTTTDNSEQDRGAEDFRAVKTLQSSPDAVLAALRTSEAISEWWAPTTGSAAEGGSFRADFDEGRHTDVLVTSVEPQRVEWTVTAAPHHHGEWDGTTISFELASAGEATRMSFRHAGLTPQLECFDRCEAGWTQVLASLVAYADTGKGNPYRSNRTH
jgi:uncharacterized protein YndB with AHSA1/START domain